MVIAGVLVQDKLEKVWFFEEIFFLADISIEVVLEIFFFTLFNIDIWFPEKEFE